MSSPHPKVSTSTPKSSSKKKDKMHHGKLGDSSGDESTATLRSLLGVRCSVCSFQICFSCHCCSSQPCLCQVFNSLQVWRTKKTQRAGGPAAQDGQPGQGGQYHSEHSREEGDKQEGGVELLCEHFEPAGGDRSCSSAKNTILQRF